MTKVYIAADHAGFALKEELRTVLGNEGHHVEDCGAYELVPGDDYPEIMRACAKRVAEDAGSVGIMFGASGQGEAMAANRVPGIRAAVFYGDAGMQTDATGETLGIVASVRVHNGANVLSIGARFVSGEQALQAVRTFLATEASTDERHVRRRAELG